MDSRRLVVWLSAGILGFQGGTLVLDLIHCSVLSWLYVRRHGLELVVSGVSVEQRPPEGIGRVDPVNAPASQRQPLAPCSCDRFSQLSERASGRPSGGADRSNRGVLQPPPAPGGHRRGSGSEHPGWSGPRGNGGRGEERP
ncbi:MAG: hypothetical protein ACK6BG_08130 [Cyanobacteriota bacterium]